MIDFLVNLRGLIYSFTLTVPGASADFVLQCHYKNIAELLLNTIYQLKRIILDAVGIQLRFVCALNFAKLIVLSLVLENGSNLIF